MAPSGFTLLSSCTSTRSSAESQKRETLTPSDVPRQGTVQRAQTLKSPSFQAAEVAMLKCQSPRPSSSLFVLGKFGLRRPSTVAE